MLRLLSTNRDDARTMAQTCIYWSVSMIQKGPTPLLTDRFINNELMHKAFESISGVTFRFTFAPRQRMVLLK